MMVAIVMLLGAALAVPFVAKVTGRWTGALVALLPAGLFIQFARQLPSTSAGQPVTEVRPWVEALGVELAFRLDGLSVMFALLILGIGAIIAVYAGAYMGNHPRLGRFFAFFLLFMAAMLGLVVSDDLFALFVFWELTSLASFFLIGFVHDKEDNRAAARQALVVTGAGGLALLGGFILLASAADTSRISMLAQSSPGLIHDSRYGWILGLVLIGAFTKSAQVPFHFWLPAAMAGPTPVSAYLHSATMVKAGIFLLARLFPVLGGSDGWLFACVSFGGATMVLSAWACFAVTDLKQILAYTTTMALGLFVLLLGIGTTAAVEAFGFYLVVHALYKAGLFMAAGGIDHETGTRDLSQLSGLLRAMPLTAAAVALTAASMAGFPPWIGFVGKESTYEAALHAGASGLVALALMILANAALIAISLTLFFDVFMGPPRPTPKPAHEGPIGLWAGPVVLGVLGLVLGPITKPLASTLIAPLTVSVAGPYETHAALWHGLTPALGLSVLTIAMGGAIFAFRAHVRASAAITALASAFVVGPGRAFERALLALHQAAERIIALIHSGKLRRYLLIAFGVLGLAAALAFTQRVALNVDLATLGDVLAHEWIVVILLIASSWAAGTAATPVRAVLALGVSGYSVALIYLLFGAPDLGMTQFSIETLTVILVALILVHLPQTGLQAKTRAAKTTTLIVSSLVGMVMGGLTLAILSVDLSLTVSEYYARNSYVIAHGHNIVNVILVDFRGFDTWGEITVLTIAGLGVYSLLRRAEQRSETGLPDDERDADDQDLDSTSDHQPPASGET